MKQSNQSWHPGTPSTRIPVLEVLYIDSRNQICTVTLSADEFRNFQYKTLAWRDITPVNAVPEPVLLGTVYWNYVSGKFWPLAARKPPNPRLPNYFRINIWQMPDGSPKFEYILIDKPVN
jgi:hypothetical protein